MLHCAAKCYWLTALTVCTGEVCGGAGRGDGRAAGVRARRSRQADGRRRHLLPVIILLPLCPRRLRRRRVSSSSGKHTHPSQTGTAFYSPRENTFKYCESPLNAVAYCLCVAGGNKPAVHSHLLPAGAHHVSHPHDLLALQHQFRLVGYTRNQGAAHTSTSTDAVCSNQADTQMRAA